MSSGRPRRRSAPEGLNDKGQEHSWPIPWRHMRLHQRGSLTEVRSYPIPSSCAISIFRMQIHRVNRTKPELTHVFRLETNFSF